MVGCRVIGLRADDPCHSLVARFIVLTNGMMEYGVSMKISP